MIGAAFGLVGGSISLSIGTAMRAVGAAATLPGSAVAAAAKKPRTPRERAVAYLAAANKDWFAARGLYAHLIDTRELCGLLAVSSADFIGLAEAHKDAPGKLQAMTGHLAELEIQSSTGLDLGPASLWLVLTELTPA